MSTLKRRSQVSHQIHSCLVVQLRCTSFLWSPTPTGDLENRAVIREPATLLITNATRSDTAKYRCEVTAADDQKSFDEIVIDLVVRGMFYYLCCQLIPHVCFRSTRSGCYYVCKGRATNWFNVSQYVKDRPWRCGAEKQPKSMIWPAWKLWSFLNIIINVCQ